MDRQELIETMKASLGRDLMLMGGRPELSDLNAFFAMFRSDPSGALNAYQEYAGAFLVRETFSQVYQGGITAGERRRADRWSELAERYRFQHRRLIEGEHFALMAAHLLEQAGWQLLGYQLLYRVSPNDLGWDYHLVAHLRFPGDLPRLVCIGSERVSTSAAQEISHVWQSSSDSVRQGPMAKSPLMAVSEAQRQMTAEAAFAIAPVSGRRGMSPMLSPGVD